MSRHSDKPECGNCGAGRTSGLLTGGVCAVDGIAPSLGAQRLDRLGARDAQTWINKVASTCQCCAPGKDAARPEKKRRCCAVGKCCEARLSSRTVNDIRACLRAALSQAVTEDLVAKNNA